MHTQNSSRIFRDGDEDETEPKRKKNESKRTQNVIKYNTLRNC